VFKIVRKRRKRADITTFVGRLAVKPPERRSNSIVATIADPKATGSITVAVNPATNTIYADGTTNMVTATIPVGNSPTGIAVNAQTNFIYVANSGFQHANDRGSVTVIDGKTNATSTLADPNSIGPGAVEVNPITNKICVANRSSNVTVIDGAHN
jgi:DNA-binding beta-propeller fold protein YncE